MSSPFGQTPFVAALPLAPVKPCADLPEVVRVGDDWTFIVDMIDDDGKPIDLTGMVVGHTVEATVGANIYVGSNASPFPVAGANGIVTILNPPTAGVVSIDVKPALTGTVAPNYPVQLSIYTVDTLGVRKTKDPQSLLALAPNGVPLVPTKPVKFSLVLYKQGPAGASNTYTAGQIEALIAAAQTQTLAQVAAELAALPPPGISQAAAQTLIAVSLAPYATLQELTVAIAAIPTAPTPQDIANLIAQALVPYATMAQVSQSLSLALAPYCTTATVTSLIASALQPYVTSSALTAILQGYTTPTQVSALITAYFSISGLPPTLGSLDILIDQRASQIVANALANGSGGTPVQDGTLVLDLSTPFFLH